MTITAYTDSTNKFNKSVINKLGIIITVIIIINYYY